MTEIIAVVTECKECNGREVRDEDDLKRCGFCNAKYALNILWKAHTGVHYK